MSVENHPNIQTVGFTAESYPTLLKAFKDNLRGKANKNTEYQNMSLKILHEEFVEFVTRISTRLDSVFGE